MGAQRLMQSHRNMLSDLKSKQAIENVLRPRVGEDDETIPAQTVITPEPDDDDDDGGDGIATKWWFWTAIGGVVVVGGRVRERIARRLVI